MKRVFFAILVIGFMANIACADTLTWDASDNANGYIVYYTDGTNNYNKNVGNVTECDTHSDLQMIPGTEYTIHVTAYNDYGESGPSNSIVYTEDIFILPADNLPVADSVPDAVNNFIKL